MTNMLMGYSKQQDAARKFLAWITSKPVYQAWFNSQAGLFGRRNHGVGERSDLEQGPGHGAVPPRSPAAHSSPATPVPPDRKAAEVLSKYIIIDMYAKAVQGMAAEDAVKWATGELQKIYA